MSKKAKKDYLRSCIVRSIAVLEDTPFILKDGEQVLSAEYVAPYVYLVVMKEIEPEVRFESESASGPFFNGHPVEEEGQ